MWLASGRGGSGRANRWPERIEDVARVCGRVYGSRGEAWHAAWRLRMAGWIVPLLNPPLPRRDTPLVLVARVLDPSTLAIVGTVVCSPD